MKKIIALSALVALGALGMACGDATSNNAVANANRNANAALANANAALANATNQVANAASQVSNAASQVANAANANRPVVVSNANHSNTNKP